MSKIRERAFAEDTIDEDYGNLYDSLSNPAPAPVAPPARTPAEEAELPSYAVDFLTQIGGGAEDAFKNTVKFARQVGSEIDDSYMGFLAENGVIPEEAKDSFSVTGALVDMAANSEPLLPETKREGFSGGSLDFVRGAAKFLLPFSLAGKALGAAGVTANVPKVLGSSAITGFLAYDPAEENLANMVESVPALQTPLTEFLASDGSDAMINRFKNAVSEVALIGVGDAAIKTVASGVKSAAATETGKQVLGAGAKLIEDFTSGVKAVKDKRDLAKKGFTTDTFKQLAGLKKEVSKDMSFADDVGGAVATAAKKDRIDGVLSGEFKVGGANPYPKKGFTAKAEKAKAELITRVFGKQPAEFDETKVLKSAGLVDDPVVSDLMKFASEQTPKTTLTWGETEARALGMTVEQAQKRFGTAGDFTAGISAVKNESIARAARLTQVINKKGLDNAEGVDALASFLEISSVEKMMSSEAGRALGSLRQTKSVSEVLSNLDVVSKRQMEAVLKSFGDDPEKLLSFGRQLGRSRSADVKDALHSYWINSVLSGPVTHLTNLASNLTFLALRPVERLGAAGVGVLSRGDKAAAREALEMYHGFYEGFRDSIRVLRKAEPVDKELQNIVRQGTKFDESGDISAERGNMLLHKFITGREETLSKADFLKMGPMGMGQELLARALTAPTDFLGASDQFMKTMAARGQKRALAYRSAVDDGLQGAEFDARVKSILSNSPLDSADTVILKNINEASGAFARETVFQEELGRVGKSIVNLRDNVPGMEYVIPFVKTPLNILDETFLKRTPIGLASGRVRNEIMSGGVKSHEAIAKMAIGSSVSASIAASYSTGNLTGAGPKNKAARERWLETNQPWSIKIGDDWYAYNRIEPIGTLIGLGARFAEVLEHNADSKTLTPEEEDELAFGVAGAFTKYVTDKSFLAGVDNVLSALEGDEYAIQQFTANVVGGFVPFSAMTRTIANADNKELRDMDSVLDRIQGGLPGLSENLPNRRNRFGDKVIAPEKTAGFLLPISHTPGGVSDKKTARINEIEMEAGIIISKPGQDFKGVELTPEEQDARLEFFNKFQYDGMTVKDAIIATADNPAYANLPTSEKASKGELIKRIYRSYLKASDANFLKQNPEISVRVEKATMDSYQVDRELNPRTGEPKAKETFIGAEQ